MELSKVEVSAVENAAKEATETSIRELTELQLILVGGGSGETIL
jgi:hypothetical protein